MCIYNDLLNNNIIDIILMLYSSYKKNYEKIYFHCT